MNSIEVIGGTKSQQEKALSMAEYCIDKLMPRMSTLDIEIRLVDGCTANGYCTKLSDTKNPREFEIEVDRRLNLRQLLETVAHEMVHVKQYARNEMCEANPLLRYMTSWKSTQVCTKTTEYWDLPWEIEAHGREVGLFVRWAQDSGYANAKWSNI